MRIKDVPKIEHHLEVIYRQLDETRIAESHTQLACARLEMLKNLVDIYATIYQWYLDIGAPGGLSEPEFSAWLRDKGGIDERT